MCCKPDVDCECDWLSELVAVELWDAVTNRNVYTDSFELGVALGYSVIFVFSELHADSVNVCFSWRHCYGNADPGWIRKPISITHCVFELL